MGFPPVTSQTYSSHIFIFDHCGGAVTRDGEKLKPAFKNATYYCNEKHWEVATKPNQREKASFLKENILPIKESGQLKMIGDGDEVIPGFTSLFVYGHTEAMMLPVIRYKDQTVVYMADLIPSAGHIPISYVMAYDIRPMVTLDEKEKFLDTAI
jgi:glyoxylase-like metal-dependent hydrolase (beta-lactamase superfamily II)